MQLFALYISKVTCVAPSTPSPVKMSIRETSIIHIALGCLALATKVGFPQLRVSSIHNAEDAEDLTVLSHFDLPDEPMVRRRLSPSS